MRKNIAYYKKVFAEIEKTDIAPIYIFKGQERYIMEELTSRLLLNTGVKSIWKDSSRLQIHFRFLEEKEYLS